MCDNLLVPSPIDRTKIPTVYPVQKGKLLTSELNLMLCFAAISKLEHDTRYWPLVYNDTILYTLKQVSGCDRWAWLKAL